MKSRTEGSGQPNGKKPYSEMLVDALVEFATVPASLPLLTLGLFSFKIPPLVLDQGPSKAWRKHINWSEGWVRENQWPWVLQPHLLFFLSGSCHFCQGPSAGLDINSGSSLSVFSAVTFLQGHASVFTFLIPKCIAASRPSRGAPVLKFGVQRWL